MTQIETSLILAIIDAGTRLAIAKIQSDQTTADERAQLLQAVGTSAIRANTVHEEFLAEARKVEGGL